MDTRRGNRPHWLFRPLFRFQGAPWSRKRERQNSTCSLGRTRPEAGTSCPHLVRTLTPERWSRLERSRYLSGAVFKGANRPCRFPHTLGFPGVAAEEQTTTVSDVCNSKPAGNA